MNNPSSPLSLVGEIPYAIRHSARARRVRVTVGNAGVVLVVPPRANLARAEAFLRSKEPWIRDRLHTWRHRRSAHVVPLNSLRLFGQPLPVRVEASLSATRALVLRSTVDILVRVTGARTDLATRALEAWMKNLARRHFAAVVAEWTPRMGVRAGRITIRGQRSRWGSCTAQGALSFNWRALLMPPEVIEYLVIHECAHLRHLDHGPRFWAMVEQFCPAFAKHRDALREAGHFLDASGWIRLESDGAESRPTP